MLVFVYFSLVKRYFSIGTSKKYMVLVRRLQHLNYVTDNVYDQNN